MKVVSFEVAIVLKEAGYPQGTENTAWYNEDGVLVKPFVFNGGNEVADAPFVMDAWLWLWREKKIYFGVEAESYPHDGTCLNDYQIINN